MKVVRNVTVHLSGEEAYTFTSGRSGPVQEGDLTYRVRMVSHDEGDETAVVYAVRLYGNGREAKNPLHFFHPLSDLPAHVRLSLLTGVAVSPREAEESERAAT